MSSYESLILGLLELDQGEVKSATKHLQDAKNGGLRDPRIPAALGRIALADNRPDVAKKMFERALKMDPQSFHARWSLGMAEARLGEVERAFCAFSQAAVERPKFEPALLDSVRCAVKLGRAAEVLATIHVAASRPRASARVRMAYADCLLAVGRIQDALAVLAPLAQRSKDAGFLFEVGKIAMGADRPNLARALNARAASLSKAAPVSKGA